MQAKEQNILTGLFIVATLALGVIVGNMYLDSRQELAESKRQYVQSVCDRAHKEIDGASEQACGDAQDKANAEYLCDSPAGYARCWVELK